MSGASAVLSQGFAARVIQHNLMGNDKFHLKVPHALHRGFSILALC